MDLSDFADCKRIARIVDEWRGSLDAVTERMRDGEDIPGCLEADLDRAKASLREAVAAIRGGPPATPPATPPGAAPATPPGAAPGAAQDDAPPGAADLPAAAPADRPGAAQDALARPAGWDAIEAGPEIAPDPDPPRRCRFRLDYSTGGRPDETVRGPEAAAEALLGLAGHPNRCFSPEGRDRRDGRRWMANRREIVDALARGEIVTGEIGPQGCRPSYVDVAPEPAPTPGTDSGWPAIA